MNDKEKQFLELELIKTEDGSHTLHLPVLGENYHSIHGAIQESRHVFIDNGLLAVSETTPILKIFEVGFGTGLNAMLTILQTENTSKNVIYHSIEKYPLEKNIYSGLNYPDFFGKSSKKIFDEMHEAPWNKTCRMTKNFHLHKISGDIETFQFSDKYHLICFDAFAPDKQPALWTYDIFQRIYQAMYKGGLLVTYSVKGTICRCLTDIGFKIKKIPGPPGKRHMLQAFK
jgi:tRNA U34 5-methylaminomethyl-2-thiouridine-forming methyltransferase MnmC